MFSHLFLKVYMVFINYFRFKKCYYFNLNKKNEMLPCATNWNNNFLHFILVNVFLFLFF